MAGGPSSRLDLARWTADEFAALPEDDAVRSPFTGWTRAHWEVVADSLLTSVWRYASPAHATIVPPSLVRPRRADGLEGFARTFLLAAFRLAGAGGADSLGLTDRYLSGLTAGSARRGPERWPSIKDRSQAIVEAASISLALYETRPWIWDRLDQSVRESLVGWLAGIHGRAVWPNNWHLFPVVVNAFLKSVGAPYRQDEIDRSLDAIDAFYRGEGWYADGAGDNFDHYAGWAFHLYTLHWARMDGDATDPDRAQVYRERARRFLDDYRLLFGASGCPLPQGRSLTYRFATVAPFWAATLAGCSPLAPGETRRLASGVVRYFLANGALDDGILTVGWHGGFPALGQAYSGSASPYWAAKAFLGLLLPEDDPAWTDVEEPLQVERSDVLRPLHAPGFVVSGTVGDGVVRVANHRSDHFPLAGPLATAQPYYRKLAYATDAPADAGSGLDSQLTVQLGGVELSRIRFEATHVEGCFSCSTHVPSVGQRQRRRFGLPSSGGIAPAGSPVFTASLSLGAVEVRVHAILDGDEAVAGGYALAGDEPPTAQVEPERAIVRRVDGLTSSIVALAGFSRADVVRSSDVNPTGRHSATPVLRADAPRGLIAALVRLGAGGDDDHGADGLAIRAPTPATLVVETADDGTYEFELDESDGVRLRVAHAGVAGERRELVSSALEPGRGSLPAVP